MSDGCLIITTAEGGICGAVKLAIDDTAFVVNDSISFCAAVMHKAGVDPRKVDWDVVCGVRRHEKYSEVP